MTEKKPKKAIGRKGSKPSKAKQKKGKPKPGFGPAKKEKPKRKLPKKSQRAKRRYILFQLANVSSSKKAFDLVVGLFPLEQRKFLGLWFIEFKRETGKGIVRCNHGNEQKAKRAILSLPKEFGPKTLKISGTLKSLRAK